MADQQSLAEKWFIDTSGQKPILDLSSSELKKHWLPSAERHDDSKLEPFTVDNDVRPLLDGKNIFPAWHAAATHLIQNPQDAQLFHSGWAMTGIQVKGNVTVTKLVNDLLAAKGDVYVALSDHYYNKGGNRSMVDIIGVDTAATDSRYPDLGSEHAKFTVFKDGTDDRAMVGSADFWVPAMSMPDHRNNRQHELSAKVFGPAVGDLEHSFVERWNDPTRDDVKGCLRTWTKATIGMSSKTPPKLTAKAIQTQTRGTHAVQVLQTFGIDYDDETYSWANGSGGEFTAWAARLRALSKATDYIYIEDQYFVPFADPTSTTLGFADYELAMTQGPNDEGYKWAPFTHLRERLLDGVDVFVITNSHIDGRFSYTAAFARTQALMLLRDAANQANAGRFVVATLEANGKPYGTHAKLLICDDEYVSLGSANFNRRSMTNDTELQLGIVDGSEALPAELRVDSWHEHLDVPRSSLTDLATAKTTFENRVENNQGRVREFPIPTEEPDEPVSQVRGINMWDHYGGPKIQNPEED